MCEKLFKSPLVYYAMSIQRLCMTLFVIVNDETKNNDYCIVFILLYHESI